MKVREVFGNYEAERYYVLDSHQDAMNEQDIGHRHVDSDYYGYSYNIHKYNQLLAGSIFLYRRPGKLAKDGKFRIYGGGIIESISEPDPSGNVIAKIKNGFKLLPPITQGDEFIETFQWDTREKPGPGWKGFWVNYGMNKIAETDFWNLISERNCEMISSDQQDELNNEEDDRLVASVNSSNELENEGWAPKSEHLPQKKPERSENEKEVYKRNKTEALNALKNAANFCEIDQKHESFKRRNKSVLYMEPHHLIPMKYQDDFEYSIDMEENIICLCSDCHNRIHYGDAEELIITLYEERKSLLEEIGIVIDVRTLLSMYGYDTQ